MTALDDFDAALAIVRMRPQASDFFGPAPQDDIDEAQRLLGLALPPSYRRFLATLGVGAFDDVEFYGIVAGKVPGSSVPSMVWRTLADRKLVGYPTTHITIMSSSYGPIFCLDGAAADEQGEYPVVGWTPSTSTENPGERLANSFGVFFRDEISRRV
jgi:hypothetical protein